MRKATAPRKPVGEQHRQAERQRQLHAERDRDDHQVVEEGAVEDRVAQRLNVVGEADEAVRAAQAVPVEEAVPGRLRRPAG